MLDSLVGKWLVTAVLVNLSDVITIKAFESFNLPGCLRELKLEKEALFVVDLFVVGNCLYLGFKGYGWLKIRNNCHFFSQNLRKEGCLSFNS